MKPAFIKRLTPERPIISVGDVARLAGTTYSAANQLVARLVESGVLHEITGRSRDRRFAYQNYVNLFQDESE